MDTAVSPRNTCEKENKENAQPTHGSKSVRTSVGPVQQKGHQRRQPKPTKTGSGKGQSEQGDVKPVLREALKRGQIVQKNGKGAAVRPPAHSQAFLTKQAVELKKSAADVLKPPTAVLSSKSAPGMYNGRIVQSKIGSMWKSSHAVGSSHPKLESEQTGNLAKNNRSQSVTEMWRNGVQIPASIRSKSLSNKPAQVTKTNTINNRPPARTISASLMPVRSRNTTVVPVKSTEKQNTNSKLPGTNKKINKAAVTSTLRQYRVCMEAAEEKRAKLADWLSSKGKVLKRPAMKTAALSKTKVSAKAQVDVQSNVEPRNAVECKPEAEASLQTYNPQPNVAMHHTEDSEGTATQSQTPGIMNTTLDLLENSNVEPQDRVDDVVVNLCDALEAMTTSSRRSDELTQVTDERNEPADTDELRKEMIKTEEAKDEEMNYQKAEEDEKETRETPQMFDASVIKYSVKTALHLQSVKKTIEDAVSSTTSRKKSNIKDLKFLTPVRRSRRIQRRSSCLPAMLVDHDPCVSSLAELVKLDDDPNAYIYRKNPSLLQDLPDHNGL